MQKNITVDGLEHPIVLSRRKGARTVRLSIKSDGTIRVTVPYGVPELLAKRFVSQKKDWIEKHFKPAAVINSDMHVGKNHRLIISQNDATRPSTRVSNTEIHVSLPRGMSVSGSEAQKAIRRACEKALSQEAERLLPQRLETLSKQHGINYASCTTKKLKSRWGACDNRSNLSFNIYLMQLDWSLIDYVICHELAHTIHHNHQEEFWRLVAHMLPDFKERRTVLKSKPTDIMVV